MSIPGGSQLEPSPCFSAKADSTQHLPLDPHSQNLGTNLLLHPFVGSV